MNTYIINGRTRDENVLWKSHGRSRDIGRGLALIGSRRWTAVTVYTSLMR